MWKIRQVIKSKRKKAIICMGLSSTSLGPCPCECHWCPHLIYWITLYLGLPWWLSSKESPVCRRHRRWTFDPWVGKWQPTPVFLPEKSLGQRSLASYSPWEYDWVTKHSTKEAIRDVEVLKVWPGWEVVTSASLKGTGGANRVRTV